MIYKIRYLANTVFVFCQTSDSAFSRMGESAPGVKSVFIYFLLLYFEPFHLVSECSKKNQNMPKNNFPDRIFICRKRANKDEPNF